MSTRAYTPDPALFTLAVYPDGPDGWGGGPIRGFESVPLLTPDAPADLPAHLVFLVAEVRERAIARCESVGIPTAGDSRPAVRSR